MPRLRRRRKSGKLGRILVIGLVVLLGLLYYRPVRAYVDTRQRLAERRLEVRTLAERKAALDKRLEELRSGATLIRGARRLGLVKPGERLFIVRGTSEWRREQARHGR